MAFGVYYLGMLGFWEVGVDTDPDGSLSFSLGAYYFFCGTPTFAPLLLTAFWSSVVLVFSSAVGAGYALLACLRGDFLRPEGSFICSWPSIYS